MEFFYAVERKIRADKTEINNDGAEMPFTMIAVV
jgi:hypothetical protein